MIKLLSALFIKNNDLANARTREQYGMLCGGAGIFLNIVLFAAKLVCGLLSGSIAITADALNNLSDAASSVITILGFKLAGRKPDPDHPFGHGRMEYVSGLMVAVLILVMGFELTISSVEKIITPEPVETSPLVIAILGASIAVKFYMFLYNRKFGRLVKSEAMKATASDSLNDCIATGTVLICTVILMLTDVQLDAYCGLLVGLFVLYSGFKSAMETIGVIMGKAPDKAFVERIEKLVMSNEVVIGTHDLIVHDYGPGRMMISLHAEVPATGDILEMHDVIDNIECELRAELGCDATIHMDPVSRDEETVELKHRIRAIIEERVGKSVEMHDFRVVKGPTHTNLIFDVVVPYRYRLSDAELKAAISEEVAAEMPECRAVVNVDKDYRGYGEGSK